MVTADNMCFQVNGLCRDRGSRKEFGFSPQMFSIIVSLFKKTTGIPNTVPGQLTQTIYGGWEKHKHHRRVGMAYLFFVQRKRENRKIFRLADQRPLIHTTFRFTPDRNTKTANFNIFCGILYR